MAVERVGTVGVHIKAREVLNNGNGTFTILIDAKEIDTKDHETLRRLFPNLTDKVYDVLNQEVLLASLAQPHEVTLNNEALPPATKVEPKKKW